MMDLCVDSEGNPVEFDELSPKGFPSVRYFVGVMNTRCEKFTFDQSELQGVAWHEIHEIDSLEKLRYTRRGLFAKVLEYMDLGKKGEQKSVKN